MLFVQVFVVVIKKIRRERDRACVSITSSLVPGCHTPELIAATKFKTTKINFGGLFGLSTKINTHENYPLYGIGHNHLMIEHTCTYNTYFTYFTINCKDGKAGIVGNISLAILYTTKNNFQMVIFLIIVRILA